MAGLGPAIPIGKTLRIPNRDARAKPTHDAVLDCFVASLLAMTVPACPKLLRPPHKRIADEAVRGGG
jgi:hypothetical protein